MTGLLVVDGDLLTRPDILQAHDTSGSSTTTSERFRSPAYVIFAGEPAKILGGGGRPDRVIFKVNSTANPEFPANIVHFIPLYAKKHFLPFSKQF